MAKIESYAPGSFCWAELSTTDPAAAKAFYAEMFGWSSVDFPMPQGVYTMLRVEGDEVGAISNAQPGVPSHWAVYFSTPDVDASAQQVSALGGKIIAGPFDVMAAGRMAIAQDPQGVFFRLWQAGQDIGATYGGPLNQIVWPELWTSDAAASAAFYGALFGWGAKSAVSLETAEYVEWQQNGQSIGGLLPMRGDHWKGTPPCWVLYVTVADCDERTAKAQSLGAKVYVEPKDIPNTGRFSCFADPQGAVINIIQMTGMHQPATA